jgi:two-component system chemotaxis response regulator CheB
MTAHAESKRDTVVLGASAGGLDALRQVLPAFSKNDEVSIFIVLHLPADGRSVLDKVLQKHTPLETAFARDGEAILPRRVYVAPPDQHLLVRGERIKLCHAARENRSRPAIDPLFRSAAVMRQGRVMGAILSGLLDDGAAGLLSVKRCGGLAFVQTADDANEAEMPSHAAEVLGGRLDGALPAAALGTHVASLIGFPAARGDVPPDVELEVQMLLGEVSGLDVLGEQGPPAPVSCPECGGPLWGVGEGASQRYRCHTGHAFGVASLLGAQGMQIEQALWAAIKGLEERAQVLQRLARDDSRTGRGSAAQRFGGEAARLRVHATTLRDVLLTNVRSVASES